MQTAGDYAVSAFFFFGYAIWRTASSEASCSQVMYENTLSVGKKKLNATFPFPQVFSLSPSPPFAREPTVTAWRGTTLGRDITNAISLIMPLRLRGSYATERHAFSYFTSSPTLDLLAAVAARVPSSKLHIPCIRMP